MDYSTGAILIQNATKEKIWTSVMHLGSVLVVEFKNQQIKT